MKVFIRIDRLVVDGLDGLDLRHGGRDRLRAAAAHELSRLVAVGGLAPALAGGLAVPSLPAPPIGARDASGPPARLGAAIAGAIYGSVGASEVKP
jgi:hypothetical protein